MFRTVIIAALTAAAAAGCAMPAVRTAVPTAPASSPAAKPDCLGDVVTVIGADTELDCDVNPPQQLNVNAVTPQECDDMGGHTVTVELPMDGLVNCHDVDY